MQSISPSLLLSLLLSRSVSLCSTNVVAVSSKKSVPKVRTRLARVLKR
jgi:hypothetical protein